MQNKNEDAQKGCNELHTAKMHSKAVLEPLQRGDERDPSYSICNAWKSFLRLL